MRAMLAIDLTGKRALVAGVADDAGYGFAIARQLAEAGATVCVGTWPPAFEALHARTLGFSAHEPVIDVVRAFIEDDLAATRADRGL